MRWVAVLAVIVVAVWVWRLGSDSGSTPRSSSERTAQPGGAPEGTKPPAKRPSEEPEQPVSASGVVLVGRVADASGKPISGARLQFGFLDDKTTAAESTTDGTFRIAGIERPESESRQGRLEITKGDVGLALPVAVMAASPDEIDLGTLKLGKIHTLTVYVRHAGKALAGARVVSGQPWFPTPIVHTGSEGAAIFSVLPPGDHKVRVACEGYARGETSVRVPDQAEVTIDLGVERVVDVTVVEKGSGKPIAGATFEVHRWSRDKQRGTMIQTVSPPLAIAPTDANGHTVIRGLHAEMALLLAVRAEGYPAPQQMFGTAGRTRLEAHLTKLLVELDPPRTIRWPVAEGPPDKTRVTLRADYGSYLKEVPAGGVMDGKELVVAGWGSGPVHAVAVAPDGSLARLWAKSGAAVGRETSFLPPRQILVHVHQPDGTPIAGIAFQLRNQGNNPMGAQLTSDADGKVRFESLSHGRQADVYLLPNPASRWGGRRVGSVNLSKGSGTVDVILQPARDLVVHVLVAGRPGLPPSYRLTSNQTPVANVEADPDKGELRVRLRPPRADRRIDLQLFAEGFQLARASTTTDTMTLEMHRAGSLAVTVLPPSDKRFSLILQKWSEKSNAWTWGGGHARKGDPIRFSPLGLGRYRVMDRQSGKAGDPVEVPEGAEAVTSLDLSGVGWVKGRVEMPEGHSPRDVRILALGLERSAQPPSGIRIGRGETFMIRVPGDREITLRASHPSLTSDNEVKVTTPSDGVVLRLKKGLTATVHLDKTPPRSLRVPGSDRARVLLFNGPVGGKPAAELRALLDKKTITFGGFKPGQYTVWIDVRPFAPIVLRGVELKKADLNDLGTVQVSDGSSIKLKILVKPGQDPPRIGLFASSKTGPSYHRGLNSRGEAEVVLKGFGPGTFVVNGGPVMGGMGRKRPIEATIELDGTNQHTLTLDLRDG